MQRLRSERGQSLVEFVLVMPLLFGLVFLIFVAGVGFQRFLKTTDAARVGARAAVVARFLAHDPCNDATQAAQHAVGSMSITVECSPPPYVPGDQITITVRHQMVVNFPVRATLNISSTAKERLE